MLPRVGAMFCKLCCGGNKRPPSLPAATAATEETNNAPPRAIHSSEMTEIYKRLPTALRPHPVGYQSLSIMVANPKGASNFYQYLYGVRNLNKAGWHSRA